MSALEQWRDEVFRRQRTVGHPDELRFQACKELEDEEFDRDYGAPSRARLAFLKDRGKVYRAPRPAKWERDLAEMVEYDVGA